VPESGLVATGGSIRRSRLAFGLLAVGALVFTVAYVSVAALRHQVRASQVGGGSGPSAAVHGPRAASILFQHVARDDNYAHVAFAPLDAPDSGRSFTSLTCERVYFAAGRGICLVPELGLAAQSDVIAFGNDFTPRGRLELDGAPSRARMSPDGRYGATTTFVAGHSYADSAFSTTTTLIDMASTTAVAELEQFTVVRDGRPWRSPDFNFWGVSFRDGDTFYATLRTGGQTYLVHGAVSTRTLEVLRTNVECPSVSPDGTRLAFKKRVGTGSSDWRLYVLDLGTMVETPVAEPAVVDDQVEWLDDERILYGRDGSIWVARSDGTGAPQRLVSDALSPAVMR
jgi:dipeptidyl aminopeptidase/acylaminoacyl peptidase